MAIGSVRVTGTSGAGSKKRSQAGERRLTGGAAGIIRSGIISRSRWGQGSSGMERPMTGGTEDLLERAFKQSKPHHQVQNRKPPADKPCLFETAAESLTRNADLFGFDRCSGRGKHQLELGKRKELHAQSLSQAGPN